MTNQKVKAKLTVKYGSSRFGSRHISPSELEGTFDEAIAFLTMVRDEAKAQYPGYDEYCLDAVSDYDGAMQLAIIGVRPLTAEEISRREVDSWEQKAQLEKHEKAELERLKRKYPGL